MSPDRRLTRPGGRVLAWAEVGAHAGSPVLRLPGTPGSRFWLRTNPELWVRRDLRMIMTERPGFGASGRHAGATFADHADDLVAILDDLEIERVPVLGVSGGAPFVLALAQRYPTRMSAATIVVGAAELADEEIKELIGLNAQSHRLSRAGNRSGLHDLLAGVRDDLLVDPLAAFRAAMATAPFADQLTMEDPGWQEMMVRGVTEALREGVTGWVDESLLLATGWSELSLHTIDAQITWWHGDGDRNAPLSAVRRAVERLPNANLVVWPDGGHLTAYQQEGEILDELVARAAKGN